MKRFFFSLILLLGIGFAATAQLNSHPESYQIDKKDIDRARQLISTPLKEKLVFPNPNPEAQWFPSASLGLFMHWGIHSVAGAQPSWDMIAHYPYGGKVSPPDKYYALADQFNPQNYDPDKWMKAAKEAGFTYAVLTTRHHDGYALWPSKYGIGTKQYMNGRDLLKPYVDACRANGLKVGFYFSPSDWHFPGFMHPYQFDYEKWNEMPRQVPDPVADNRDYHNFLGYVLKQIEELMTNYGKIDLLWFDGMYFKNIDDMHTEQVYAWIRSLQPGIVINDRWSNVTNPDNPHGSGLRIGDFTTPFECTTPTYVPSKWFDNCVIWTGGSAGWGYDRTGSFRSNSNFIEQLVTCRMLGGNFLPNLGPTENGELHPNFYTTVAELAEWMKHSKESVIGAGLSPGMERSNVMITTRGNNWYLHLFPSFKNQVSVKTDKRPKSVSLLQTGEAIPYNYRDGFVTFNLSEEKRTMIDDVVKVGF